MLVNVDTLKRGDRIEYKGKKYRVRRLEFSRQYPSVFTLTLSGGTQITSVLPATVTKI